MGGYVFSDEEKKQDETGYAQDNFGGLGITAEIFYCFLPGRAGGGSCTDQNYIPEKAAN